MWAGYPGCGLDIGPVGFADPNQANYEGCGFEFKCDNIVDGEISDCSATQTWSQGTIKCDVQYGPNDLTVNINPK